MIIMTINQILIHGGGLYQSLHVGPVIQIAPVPCCIVILGSDSVIQGPQIVPITTKLTIKFI